LLEGIKKWLEETTMLPSDHHLRIYKLLGKHACKKKTHKEEPDDTQDDTRIKQGCDILFLTLCYLQYITNTHFNDGKPYGHFSSKKN